MELIFLFFGSFGAVVILFLAYSGFFKPVLFSKVERTPFYAAFTKAQGDYKDIPHKQIEVFNALQNKGIESNVSFGIYYDDPKKVAKEQLRAVCGVIIDEAQAKALEGSGIELLSFPKMQSYKAGFVYKSGLSIMLAIIKVYPAFKKFAKRLGVEPRMTLEIYDFPNKQIEFYFPLENEEALSGFYA